MDQGRSFESRVWSAIEVVLVFIGGFAAPTEGSTLYACPNVDDRGDGTTVDHGAPVTKFEVLCMGECH